jgi:hypothetical protein
MERLKLVGGKYLRLSADYPLDFKPSSPHVYPPTQEVRDCLSISIVWRNW